MLFTFYWGKSRFKVASSSVQFSRNHYFNHNLTYASNLHWQSELRKVVFNVLFNDFFNFYDYIVSVVPKWCLEHWSNDTEGKSEVVGEKHVSVPLSQPKMPCIVQWSGTEPDPAQLRMDGWLQEAWLDRVTQEKYQDKTSSSLKVMKTVLTRFQHVPAICADRLSHVTYLPQCQLHYRNKTKLINTVRLICHATSPNV